MKKHADVLKELLSVFISVIVWLLLWELLAYHLDLTFIFPGAIKTIKTLSELALTLPFWKTIALSMLRIFFGLFLGVIFGIAFALIYHFVPFLRKFIDIGMTVIKATPVASIIMVLWVILSDGSRKLPAVIGLLMVMPIIWQNLCDGFDAVDKELGEVCDVFCLSHRKRFKLLILPPLLKFFVPAFLTSVGLAWKSGIAAEIISYTKSSIGKNILDAKNYFEGDVMLAWTLSVIILSLCFEKIVKALLGRWRKWD